MEGGIGLVVEVAGDDDHGHAAHADQAVGMAAQRPRHLLAVAHGTEAVAAMAGPVAHHEVEGVAAADLPHDVQHVAGEADIVCRGRHTQGAAAQQPEALGLVEQGYVDAAAVGRPGADIAVVQTSQPGAPAQVAQHAVVLHLGQRHEVHGMVAAGGGQHAHHAAQFAPIALTGPPTG